MTSRKSFSDLNNQAPRSDRSTEEQWYQRSARHYHGNQPHSYLYSNSYTPQIEPKRVSWSKPPDPSSPPSEHPQCTGVQSQPGPVRDDSFISINCSQFQSPSQQFTQSHGKERRTSHQRNKKRKRDHVTKTSSAFRLGAESTPHPYEDSKPSPKPITIPIPINYRLTANVLRSRAETSRRIAQEQASMPKFASHISDTSSSGTSSESESDKSVFGEEKDDGNEDTTTSESSSDTDNDSPSVDGEGRSQTNFENKADPGSKSDGKVRSKQRGTSKSSTERNTSHISGPTIINTELEASLLHSLSSLIPIPVRTYACTQLTRELQVRHGKNKADTSLTSNIIAKTSKSHDQPCKGKPRDKDTLSNEDSGNKNDLSVPTPTAITLKAARNLILRLSGQRLSSHQHQHKHITTTAFVSSSSSSSFSSRPHLSSAAAAAAEPANLHHHHNDNNGSRNSNGVLEADLARIANDRGKRIQDLERENQSLKVELSNMISRHHHSKQ